jgi:hypothetical protein
VEDRLVQINDAFRASQMLITLARRHPQLVDIHVRGRPNY